jgi:uncharacterized membrane protein
LIYSLLFQLSPHIRAFIAPLNGVLLIIGLLLGLLRIFQKTDNTHNALYFALALSAFMHIYQDVEFGLITTISLMSLFCSVIQYSKIALLWPSEMS